MVGGDARSFSRSTGDETPGTPFCSPLTSSECWPNDRVKLEITVASSGSSGSSSAGIVRLVDRALFFADGPRPRDPEGVVGCTWNGEPFALRARARETCFSRVAEAAVGAEGAATPAGEGMPDDATEWADGARTAGLCAGIPELADGVSRDSEDDGDWACSISASVEST